MSYFQSFPLEITANLVNGERISQSNQTTKPRFRLLKKPSLRMGTIKYLPKHRFILITSSGKRAGNLFLEKYFGARSPQTLLLRTSHLLSGCNNCRPSIREKGEYFFLGIEPRELHKFDCRLILIKLLRYVNYEIRHS